MHFRASTVLYPSAVVLVSAFAATALGQSSSGAFGNRSVGGSFSPAPSSFSGSAAGRGGAGGFGATGGAAAGGIGTIAGATQRADNAGEVTGSERFVRQARQPGQFVGSDSRDAGANFLSQLATASVMNAGRPLANNNTDVNRSTSTSANSQYIVRVKTDYSSIAPITSPSKIGATLANRLTQSKRIAHQGPIEVRLEGATAVLTGYVATVHDRALAERVALLEPGVAGVRNELLVTIPPTQTPPPPVALPPRLPALPGTLPGTPPGAPATTPVPPPAK
jgi:osmotically-inducible protein OsmY